jgi:hypothetical protein
MTIDNDLEGLFRAIDPLSSELEIENAIHAEAIWSKVLASTRPIHRKRRGLSYVGVGSLATLATVTAVLLGTLPGTAPLGAAAATLRQAALADASSATLPTLAAGQYYYQEAQVSMVCQFAKAGGSSDNRWISYVSKGTMQSWTSPDSVGQIVITPTPVNQGGSHFATPADEARWLAEGKPFVPCALLNTSNTMVGNPANANSQSPAGGFAASVSGYSGFGFILGIAQQATPVYVNGVPVSLVLGGGQSPSLSAGTNVSVLPSDVDQIASMLANGEINADGSTSNTPQICPVDAGANAAPGCNTNQQLSLIEQLLQLPEASAKFGSVLYDILAQMPGATVATNSTDSFGNTGSAVTVPVGGSAAATSEFQVVVDPNSGALLSSTALDQFATDGTASATYSPEASISYGSISVAQTVGALPSATK